MSTTDETANLLDEAPPASRPSAAGGSSLNVPALSFKQRLAQRRKELGDDPTFVVPVYGYEDQNLWARYRVLGYDDTRDIGLRVEAEGHPQATAERLTAATTLAEAAIELLEYKGLDAEGEPILEGLGYAWTAAAARDLFEVELPDGVIARDALLQIFPHPRDLLMMKHFEDYVAKGMGFIPEIERILQGESPAA